MKVDFVEKYERLDSMHPGDTAISKDRSSFFVCGWQHCKLQQKNIKIILDVNNLTNQYTDSVDMSQPVKILKTGDKFVCLR